MIDLADSICLGTIAKAHGIKGRVVVKLDQYSCSDIIDMESIFIEIDGFPVPFFIEDYEEKSVESLILNFENINDEENAKELNGCRLFILKKNIRIRQNKDIIQEPSFLKDYTVTDQKLGKLGKVKDIIEIDLNPLLQIANKKREILIPLQPEFLTNIDQDSKILYTDIPEGLIDLF